MTAPSRDARRILNEEATQLRAHLQRAERKAGYLAEAKKNAGWPNEQMYLRMAHDIGPVDVAAQMAEAKRVLEMWRNV